MTALVITHTESEGPGLIGDWLTSAGLGLDVVEPWRGDPLPTDLGMHEALVVMGGPQQAYDDRSAPWLRDTKALLRRAVSEGVPVLGVCLGAQLLAEATGGRVTVGEQGPELGARLVAKRDAAGADPVFWDLPLAPVVVQWHWDAIVDLPAGATLLASSSKYANQAFRLGDSAWGIQFHVETDEAMVTRWVEADTGGILAAGLDPETVLARTLVELGEIADVWGTVVQRFAALALSRR